MAWKNKESRRNLVERQRERERFLRRGFHRAKNITVNIAHGHACAVLECFFLFFFSFSKEERLEILARHKTTR